MVSVLGAGFSRELRFVCDFQPKRDTTDATTAGAAAAAVQVLASVLSSSELACIAPPVAHGDELRQAVEVTVSVDLGNGEWTSLPPPTQSAAGSPTTFTYVPRLQLTHLSPDRGSKGGGAIVDVIGANFVSPLGTPETVWCRFGSSVTIGSRLSDGLVRCSSPPWGMGGATNVEVSVSVNSGADFEGGPSESPLVSASGICALTKCLEKTLSRFLTCLQQKKTFPKRKHGHDE